MELMSIKIFRKNVTKMADVESFDWADMKKTGMMTTSVAMLYQLYDAVTSVLPYNGNNYFKLEPNEQLVLDFANIVVPIIALMTILCLSLMFIGNLEDDRQTITIYLWIATPTVILYICFFVVFELQFGPDKFTMFQRTLSISVCAIYLHILVELLDKTPSK
ncbi:unnamed protein product, partial [Iphiclides podalirius]